MKYLLLMSFVFIAPTASFAGAKEELAQVRLLANKKVSGADVKKKISVFNNVDGDPCAEEGITYLVKVYLRKSVLKENPGEGIGQSRVWEEFNTYWISRRELLKGGDLSDTLCQE